MSNTKKLRKVLGFLLVFGPALFLILISTRGCKHKFQTLDDYGQVKAYTYTDSYGKTHHAKEFQGEIILITTIQKTCPWECSVSFWRLNQIVYQHIRKNSHKKHEAKQVHHKSAPAHIKEDDMFSNHRFGSEVLIGFIIFAMGLFFMVPFYTAASADYQLIFLLFFMLMVLAFIVSHWRKLKKHKDNPEMPLMERFVYLSIVSILSIAIIAQVITRTLDLWLVGILVITILLKVLLTSGLGRK